MYNRYVRSEHGTYTRIPEDDGPPPERPRPEPPKPEPSPGPPPPGPPKPGPPKPGPLKPGGPARPPQSPPGPPPPPGQGPPFSLRRLLDGANLEQVEAGDLLLLGLLLLLIREGADEELLAALGLLLIL